MKLKSYIREKIIAVVRYAVREEFYNCNSIPQIPENTNEKSLEQAEEEIISCLDKQIERWTWERYKRLEHENFPKLERQLDTETWNLKKELDKKIEQWTWERYKRIEDTVVPKLDKQVEKWTWERYGRMLSQFQLMENQIAYYENRIPYLPEEKIRIAILYQIPSCWPSIESVYEILMEDDRFEVTLLLYDYEQKEVAQMAGAREFLQERGISFREAEYFDFKIERPHILLYQTPWDDAHRPAFLKSDAISALGIRVAYIPYGINYSASVYPEFVFSDNKFKVKPWLMFCLSEELRVDHQRMSAYGGHYAIATGLPKFDALYHKERYQLSKELLKKIGDKKVVFMQMHFAAKEGNPYIPVPDIVEYLKFLEKVSTYQGYFFLVRPHPKFFETYLKNGCVEEVKKMKQIIGESENVYLYDESDYRPAMFRADCIVGDRSALMVEAAVLNIPVLYMTNFYYQEKMLPSIEPIFESYYQGNTCYDIEQFLDYVVSKGNDYKKQERKIAREKCIPYFDGLCSKRIVDAMVKILVLESEVR